jgi:hypothetical protein
MDALASVAIDRCIRMCKFKMLKISELVVKVSLPSKIVFDSQALELYHTYGCTSLMRLVHANASPNVVACAMHFQTHLQIFPMVPSMRERQLQCVREMYSSCFNRVYQVCHLHICIMCTLAGKGILTPMRQCSITGDLSCSVCQPGTIITIGMIGVILRICSISYYMCPVCAKIKCWDGDGTDFHSTSCACLQNPRQTSSCRRCHVCHTKNVQPTTLLLPYVRGKVLRAIPRNASSGSRHLKSARR